MNPSTDDILSAIHATAAKRVFVLPNNKNIIMAAEQAANLADRKVDVLQTRTIPQGLSAMLAFDRSAQAGIQHTTINRTLTQKRLTRRIKAPFNITATLQSYPEW